MNCLLPADIKAANKIDIFSPEELAQLDKRRVPNHIAIVPDGNRRWAKRQLFSIESGHRKGTDNLITTVNAAKEIGIKAITFYMFSTENWSRNSFEVKALMSLLEFFLETKTQEMIDEGVRFHTIGDLSKLSKGATKAIEQTKALTAGCNGIDMIAALNYGSRDELCRAFKQMLADKLNSEDITEAMISRYLDTSQWTDPELFIRTGGEKRVSNFLLWQISYSELYVSDVLWPDFTSKNLMDAVLFYQSRERRLGV